MTRFFLAVLLAASFAGAAASAASENSAATARGAPSVSTATTRTAPTDIGAARHYRYVRNRWRVVQPATSYGVYGPRPYYYQPHSLWVPFPFGFGFGFDPYYW
jgi:hypothetical protein